MNDGLHALQADTGAMGISGAATLIVVLGMHRGGTSVIVRAMETMGAELGNRLGAPVAGENDKGFFEDLDVVALNEAVLAAAGASWHSLAPVEPARIAASKLDALRARAVDILRDKCRDGIFALKDPRLSRLLPFWQAVFEQLSLNVVYVIAVRHPASVARSLHKRDGFLPDKAYPLWLAHMVPALRGTQGKRRVLVEYDHLMDAPRSELVRISVHLGLVLDPARAQAFECEFLDRGLQHWRSDTEGGGQAHSMPCQVGALFDALRGASQSGLEPQPHAFDRVVADAQLYLEGMAPELPVKRRARLLASLFERVTAIYQMLQLARLPVRIK